MADSAQGVEKLSLWNFLTMKYFFQPVPVQYQQFQYNPAVQQSWAEGIQLQPGQATFM